MNAERRKQKNRDETKRRMHARGTREVQATDSPDLHAFPLRKHIRVLRLHDSTMEILLHDKVQGVCDLPRRL